MKKSPSVTLSPNRSREIATSGPSHASFSCSKLAFIRFWTVEFLAVKGGPYLSTKAVRTVLVVLRREFAENCNELVV